MHSEINQTCKRKIHSQTRLFLHNKPARKALIPGIVRYPHPVERESLNKNNQVCSIDRGTVVSAGRDGVRRSKKEVRHGICLSQSSAGV